MGQGLPVAGGAHACTPSDAQLILRDCADPEPTYTCHGTPPPSPPPPPPLPMRRS